MFPALTRRMGVSNKKGVGDDWFTEMEVWSINRPYGYE